MNHIGGDGRQVALHIDDDVVATVGVNQRDGFEDPVRTGWMISPRQLGTTARRFNSVNDIGGITRHDDRADIGLHGTTPNMDNHRLAMNIGQRLARQAF